MELLPLLDKNSGIYIYPLGFVWSIYDKTTWWWKGFSRPIPSAKLFDTYSS